MPDTSVIERNASNLDLIADREAEIIAQDPEVAVVDVVSFAPALPVSDAAAALIIRHETGGPAYYNKVIKARPCWPAGDSGVTIGFGYDIGYNTEAGLRRDWAALGDAALRRLATACGRHSDPALKALAASIADITVPWDLAETVFRAVTMPRFIGETMAALPDCSALSPDSFGALVSLTFNRGASYGKAWNPAKDPKDRYREMRAIKAAMAVSRFAEIPPLILAMIRLWRGTAIEEEMTRRRKNEAALFAYGLTAQAGPYVPTFDLQAAADGGPAGDEDLPVDSGPNDEAVAPDGAEFDVDAVDFGPATSAAAVTWSPDDVSPDYGHLVEALPQGGLFRLSAATLQALADANGYDLPTGRMLFGLRGCAIVANGGEFADEVTLRDIRPDHQVARCVLGVWDRAAGKVAVFPGSTVPNAAAVVSWRVKHDMGNLLPTGLYGYIVGIHNGKPGCFLLRKGDGTPRTVIVRRSSDDLRYSLDDMAHQYAPGDNIHPTFFQTAAAFSSVGCQVVIGSAKPDGTHTGPWAHFRALAGQTGGTGQPGTPYSYMLFTAAEAALAARAAPRRLRFGSSGSRVMALQQKLGLTGPDGHLGANTAAALHKLQKARAAGRSDGIYSPALDDALGWSIFGA